MREGPAGERTIHLCLRRKNGFQAQASQAKPAYQAFSIGTHPKFRRIPLYKDFGKGTCIGQRTMTDNPAQKKCNFMSSSAGAFERQNTT